MSENKEVVEEVEEVVEVEVVEELEDENLKDVSGGRLNDAVKIKTNVL